MGRRKKVEVIWSPQPKQLEALAREEYEILYGGARGGGKTDAGMAWLLYPKDNPLFRGLVIRQQSKDLSDWIDRAKRMYRGTGAEFVGSPVEIRFPSGALIRTGHLNDSGAYNQYQGHEYQKMLIEELTQIPDESNYEKLIGSCRSTVPDISPQVFCTTNPGELGHEWVKRRWRIDQKGLWGKSFIGMRAEVSGKVIERTRVFIHATMDDNPKLLESDPGYVAMIESMSDLNLRKAWRYGDWDNPIIPGLIYQEEFTKAYTQGKIGKVEHDPRYPVYTYWDIGVGDLTAIWFAQFKGGAWYFIDYMQGTGKGISFYRTILSERSYFYGGHFGPHDLAKRQIADKDNAESIAKIAEELGIVFTIMPRTSPQARIIATKEKFSLAYIDEKKCEDGLKALKAYRREYDEDKQKFKDTPVHDWSSHAADAFGLWAEAPDPLLPGTYQEAFQLYSHSYT